MEYPEQFTEAQLMLAELFSIGMKAAALREDHILQNIPVEVYAGALVIFGQNMEELERRKSAQKGGE